MEYTEVPPPIQWEVQNLLTYLGDSHTTGRQLFITSGSVWDNRKKGCEGQSLSS